jgi:hypothetical protein
VSPKEDNVGDKSDSKTTDKEQKSEKSNADGKPGGDVLCYPNFLLFLAIFDEKIGIFLKNQWYDQIFA